MISKLTHAEWRQRAAISVAAPPSDSDDLVVAIESGLIRGAVHDGARIFKGIPYASPPIGDLRWRAPALPVAWREVRPATAAPLRCPQPHRGGPPVGPESEDCLYLNVTAPISSTRWPLPVMVWLHGGAFLMGSGADYGAERMAAQGEVMVVTINYRLGAFGFFGFPGLKGSGQFGLLDQQAALAWVRRNAAAFGGDPANVTLFGESAGAISTALQLVSPEASGLFDKAILQSGSPLQRWERNIYLPDGPPVQACTPVEQVRDLGVDIARTLKCRDLEELRKIPAADLVKLFPATQPAYGDGVLPEDPTIALQAGRFHPRPLIWGGTRDEHRLWVSTFGPQVLTTVGELSQLLKEAYSERAQDIEQRYPIGDGGPRSAWAAIATDRGYAEPFYESFKLAARRAPLYAFEFADRDAPSVIPMPAEFPLGAAHATELGYLFDVRGDRAPLSDGQSELANQMIAYWTNFAAAGDPNGPGLPEWPRFDVDDGVPATMGLEPHPTGCAPFDYAARHQYEFWATVR